MHTLWLRYRNFCLEYCFSIDNTIIRDNVPINIPTTHRTHALIGRREPPKPGKNSDFGPNPDFFQRFWWCVSGGGYVSPGTLSEYYLLPTPSTRRIEITDKIALRMCISQFRNAIFGFRPGIYYRVPLVNRLGWYLRKFCTDWHQNVFIWCKNILRNTNEPIRGSKKLVKSLL